MASNEARLDKMLADLAWTLALGEAAIRDARRVRAESRALRSIATATRTHVAVSNGGSRTHAEATPIAVTEASL